MARKAKRKRKVARTKKRGARKAKKGAKRRTANAKKNTRQTRSTSDTRKAQRRQKEPIPAEPAGRIGLRRPSNLPKPQGSNEPREIAQAEPDARFDDQRRPEVNARDPEEAAERSPDERRYKNTGEAI